MQGIAYMARYKKWLAGIVVLLLALPALALQDYEAVYKISVRGVSAGTVYHDATFTPSSYRVDTVAEPSLAAKMLGFGVINESAYGTIMQGGQIQPQHYQRTMDGDADFRLVYDYRPKLHEIDAQIGNNKQVLKYDADIHPLDVLALVVQSLLDDEHNRMAGRYSLVNDDKIRTYTVEKLPDETWKTQEGDYIKIRIFRQVSGERQTKIYLADNPLRLVQLTQLKGDQARFNLKLIDYRTL